MGQSGGSAERKAELLRASGDADAAAWAAGAEGERRVAEALTALPVPWVVLHDRLLRPGLTESNLDHVIVGPAGVILVDAKNWGGRVTEWEANLFQHRRDAVGATSHTSKHAEIAKLHAMGREMATRTGSPVTSVLCLAGLRATQFGEPRQVRGIWVVPVHRLVEWVLARPPTVPADALPRLSTLVMTEFPSTTTDPDLLAAIGADLRRTTPNRRRARRRRASPVSSNGTRRSGGPPARRTTSQSRLAARRLLALLVVVAMWWAVTHGALTVLLQLGARAGGSVGGSVLRAMAPTPAPAPDRLSCDDVEARSIKLLRRVELTPVVSPLGCDWLVDDGSGRRLLAIRIRELTGSNERMHPMLRTARERGRPEVVGSHVPTGDAVFLWAPAGVPMASSKKAPTASRSMVVQVSRELLDLSAADARRLATAIAKAASAAHNPTSTPSTTTSRS